jgi:hypothetical protein
MSDRIHATATVGNTPLLLMRLEVIAPSKRDIRDIRP